MICITRFCRVVDRDAPPFSVLRSARSATADAPLARHETCCQLPKRWVTPVDVTLAFRSLGEPLDSPRFRVISIEDAPTPIASRDDVTVRGLNPLTHARYLRTLRQFARRAAGEYDIVLEKGWRFSGYLAHQVTLCGGLSALIENDVRYWNEPVRNLQAVARFTANEPHSRSRRAVRAACRWSSRKPKNSREALVALRGISPERIAVVELGVDHRMFHPTPQDIARNELGIAQDVLMLLYVGGWTSIMTSGR